MRINSYELAYRMQMAAPNLLHLSLETAATHQLYGLDQPACTTFARQCLLSRRLVERGVRFVQIFAGKGVSGDGSVNDVPWDCHSDLETNHCSCGLHTDQPAAALLTDLDRGLLDTTLVIWGGEFGRTSDSQGAKGRDHNPNGFTIWLAGAGVRWITVPRDRSIWLQSSQNKVHEPSTICTPLATLLRPGSYPTHPPF